MMLQFKRWLVLVGIGALMLGSLPVQAQDVPDPLGGADTFARADEHTEVVLVLDWTPNTNHTGFYVAQARGYFDDANLAVTIQEPTDLLVEALLVSGAAQFGVSYQEFTTYAQVEGLPVVSVAAIVQHNTSGFVTLHDRNPVERPADLAGLRYGGFGQPELENAIIDRLLSCDGAEAGQVKYIDVGWVDIFELMERDRVDLGWIYYGWSGIEGEQRGLALDAIMLMDYRDCIPDYYTPVLITSADMITEQPDVVAAFVQATARGYANAIQHPAEAADMLLAAVPELDPNLVQASVAWLASQYQADAPRWGQQSMVVWQGFSDFLVAHDILAEGIDAEAAFTNDFLPGTVEIEETD